MQHCSHSFKEIRRRDLFNLIIAYPFIDGIIFVASGPIHLLRLFRLDFHFLDTRVVLTFDHPPKERMGVTLGHVPFVQFLHISDAIELATLPEVIGVLRQESFGNDATGMILAFEMRVRKAKKQLVQGRFAKVMWQKLHRVGSQDRCVAVFSRMIFAKRNNSQSNKLRHLGSDFHTQNGFVGQQRREGH
jgi:hypothetical protein